MPRPRRGAGRTAFISHRLDRSPAARILLGTVVHTGGLGAGATYSGSLTAAVPALAPGSYYVIVEADSLYQIPDPNRANNTLTATGQLAVSLPSLTLGKAATGSFTAAEQQDYYQVTVPAGGSLVVSAASAASSGALAVYVSQGTLPTPYNDQVASAIPNQPSQTAVVPQVLTAGTYDILVESVSGAAATSGYTLTVTQGNTPTISGLSTTSGGNAGNLTVGIDGTNFAPTATAALTLGGSTIAASAIDFVSASQIYATFDLKGAAVGNYTLSVHQGSQAVTAPTPLQVVAATAGTLSVSLSVPQLVRVGRTGTIVVNYANTSENDIVAPLLTISSTNANVFFSTPDDPNNYVQSAEVLAVAPSGPAGILRPGQSGQLSLTLLAQDSGHEPIPVEVAQIEAGQTIDWSSQESTIRPSTISTAAWNAIWTNLMAMVGTTTDSYNAALAQAATYLGGVGETTAQVSDVSRLWSFLTAQADAAFPTGTLDLGHRCRAADAGQPDAGHRPDLRRDDRRPRPAGPLRPRLDDELAGLAEHRRLRQCDHRLRRFLRRLREAAQRHLPGYGRRIRRADPVRRHLHLHGDLRHPARLPGERAVELRAGHQRQPDHPGLQYPGPAHQLDLLESSRTLPSRPSR